MGNLKRLLTMLTLALPLLTEAGAQERGISFSAGAASFRMDDMKYYQEYILGTYPVEGRIISSFPVYTTGQIYIVQQLYPHIRIGGGYGFSNTGAKSNYTDLSGNITTSMLALSHRIGAYIAYRITGGDRMELCLYGRVEANISTMEISTSIYAAGFTAGVFDKYRSVSPNGSAGIEFLYNLGNFSLGIEGGYLIDLPGKLKNVDNDNMLYDPVGSHRELTSDWSGWKSGIKVVIWMRPVE